MLKTRRDSYTWIVKKAAKAELTCKQIADKTGVKYATVRSVVKRHKLPHRVLPVGRPNIVFTRYWIDEAKKRGMSPQRLRRMILNVVEQDNLVLALMDDGVK